MDMPSDAKSIFGKALELSAPADRTAYVQRACGNDSTLLREVEGLLNALEKAGHFMSRPAVTPPEPAVSHSDNEIIGTTIGPYKLFERLGEGGMGAVYLAEQEQPVRRRVALKLIKADVRSRQVLARFEQERQALAMMDHPNIAQVLDAGTTDGGTTGVGAGSPYVVMELVKGRPITRFCDEGQLTPRERLELFIPVCQAVQHAHQKGIIHRDLKPSNVLVTLYDGRPVPKVIDFGVAKAIGQSLSERTLMTEVGVLVGTLEYMSPEQADLDPSAVHDIDTRADIYSLGVILYELLTGSPPFTPERLRDAGIVEMLRLIKEVEPKTPSTKLLTSEHLPSIAATRKLEPRQLTRLISGELDWMVMKCLEKERDRRYETANALASDIERYLADEPVLAGPPSRAYRLWKFVRRNRRFVTAAVAFVLLLVTAVVALSIALVAVNGERRQKDAALAAAARRQKQTRAALDAMTSDVIGEWLSMQRALSPEHEQFLETALRHYEEFAADTGQQEDARAGVAQAYVRMGTIRQRLGQGKDAEAAWDRGRALYASLVTDFPRVPDYEQALAETYLRQGMHYNATGRRPEAEQAYRQAIAVQRQLVSTFPNVPNYRRDLAVTLYNMGILFQNTGQLREAERTYREALALLNPLAAEHPKEPSYRYALGGALQSLAFLLDRSPGRSREGALSGPGLLHEAADTLDRAVSIFKQLVAEFPARPAYRDSLARAHDDLANILRDAGEYEQSEAAFNETLAVRKQLVADFPMIPVYRRGLAITFNNLGILYKNTDRAPQAEELFFQTVAIHSQLAADFPNVPDHQNEAAGAMVNLARLLFTRKDLDGARRLLEDALPYHRAALAANPAHPAYLRFYRNNRRRLAETLIELKDHAGAAAAVGQLIEAAAEPARDAYTAAGLLAGCVHLAAEDEQVSDREREELVTTYGDRALAALRQAIEKGAEEVTKMKTDPSLDPLRGRADFQKLLDELE